MTYHDVPGHAFHGDGQAMLTEAVSARRASCGTRPVAGV